MTSSRRLRLSPLAEDDLRDVLDYSLRTWGAQQHDTYAAAIEAAFQTIVTYPESGRARDDLRPGLRRYVVEQRAILYRVEGDMIGVLRIVHQRQNTPARIDE